VRAPELLGNLGGEGASEESFLCCLRPQPNGMRELWRLPPPEGPKVPAAWEGAPLVAGGRLWAVYAKFEGGRVVHVAACYDPVDGDGSRQRPAWTTELCDGAQPVSGDGRSRQELLTLAGRHLIFCSNGGAVVAVDALTGQRAWGFRYPRGRRSGGPDPAPAVAFGGRVFVAPADGERVYGLDAGTGRVVWESGPTEGARILGVARGRLIVSVAGPYRSLRGLNLDTGSYRDGGWVQETTLPSGQGLVTDDAILWPSRAGLLFVDPETGRRTPGGPNPLPPPAGAPGFSGNLAYADGVLVVVTPTQVWGYRAVSNPPPPRPDAPPSDRFHWIVDRAERAFAAGDRAAGLADLLELAAGEFPAHLRAWAAARLVQMSPPASNWKSCRPRCEPRFNPRSCPSGY
jgi:outer membrane protein assembly factor BamB